jgi:hypothetical protein
LFCFLLPLKYFSASETLRDVAQQMDSPACGLSGNGSNRERWIDRAVVAPLAVAPFAAASFVLAPVNLTAVVVALAFIDAGKTDPAATQRPETFVAAVAATAFLLAAITTAPIAIASVAGPAVGFRKIITALVFVG